MLSAPNNSSNIAIAAIINTTSTIGMRVFITLANELTLTYEVRLATAVFKDDRASPVTSNTTSTTNTPIASVARSFIAFLISTIKSPEIDYVNKVLYLPEM